jgi:hypothetical protein
MTEGQRSDGERVGLCHGCRHARRLTSAKGSVFYLCSRARHDPAFREYPPLPVRTCEGYELSDEGEKRSPDR